MDTTSINHELMGLLVDFFNINYFVINTEGVYLARNHALTEIVGDVENATVIDEKAWHSCQEVMRTRQRQVIEEEYQGHWYLSIKVPLVSDNKVEGVIGIAIDITKQKELEFALLKAKEEAEVANYTKTLFMENMSHDFKTPLNGIYGVVQILQARKDLPEDVQQFVEAQYKSILRLNKLVQSILDFDRIASGKINLQEEELNLLDIIESIIHNLSFQLKDKNVNIHIKYPTEVPHYLISDSYAVTSILLNLLSNALKFTDEGHVTIDVNKILQNEQQVILKIQISDTGCGIPQDKLQQIFERFHRLEPSHKGLKEGHGIGLSVVKEFIAKLNGKIEVESILGKGSTFTLTLPFKIQNTRVF